MDSQPASSRRRTYAEWYVWSRRNLTNNSEICHAAAQAATEAGQTGSDPATAARAAGQSRSGPGWVTAGEPALKGYAEWYDWSRTNLQLNGEALHTAAAAAIGAIDAGGDTAAASAAARATVPGAPETPPAGWDRAAAAPPVPPVPPVPPLAPLPPIPSGAPAVPPPPHEAPGAGQGSHPAGPAFAAGHTGPPVWVAITLGIACGLSIPVEIAFITVAVMQADQQTALGAAAFSFLFGLILLVTVLALVGIIRRASWSRAMTIIAGAAICLSCVGILLGLPIIIGSATARARS